jgi:hypothetical protein
MPIRILLAVVPFACEHIDSSRASSMTTTPTAPTKPAAVGIAWWLTHYTSRQRGFGTSFGTNANPTYAGFAGRSGFAVASKSELLAAIEVASFKIERDWKLKDDLLCDFMLGKD